MAGFRVSPKGLTSSGDQLSRLAGQLEQVLTGFEADLAGFGRPWGDDDLGSLIGAAHDEVSAWAFECYRSGLEEIAAAGADLGLMGSTHAAADEAVGRDVEGLQAGLDSGAGG
jgi:hypothetical protein